MLITYFLKNHDVNTMARAKINIKTKRQFMHITAQQRTEAEKYFKADVQKCNQS